MQQILAGGATAAAAMALVLPTGWGSGDDSGNATAGSSSSTPSVVLPAKMARYAGTGDVNDAANLRSL